MSFRVSALKWRPRTFDQVKGQDHICLALKNAIRTGRVAHAFLFTGTRGLGKTTTARIMAKALNCEDGPTPEPCDRCISCTEISEGRAIDVIEMDGASNRGIDEIREIRERVRYTPAKSRYKIYIIDEVHMLTTPAFNALLKTLEEPPSHIVFIFATTEPHRLPITILSRCQRFDFRLIPLKTIADQLQMIATEEGIEVSRGALETIASRAEGSMRDAESLFDQVVSYSGKRVSDEALTQVLGLIEREVVERVLTALAERDASALLELVHDVAVGGHNLREFSGELIRWLRNLLAFRMSGGSASFLELPESHLEVLKEFSERFTAEELEQFFSILSRTYEEMRYAGHPRYLLEMAFVRMTRVASIAPLADIIQRLADMERRIKAGGTGGMAAPGQANMELGLFNQESSQNPAPTVKEEKGPLLKDSAPPWNRILEEVNRRNRSLGTFLEGALEANLNEERLSLKFNSQDRFALGFVQEPERVAILKDAIMTITGRRLPVEVSHQDPPPGEGEPQRVEEDKGEAQEEGKGKDVIRDALEIFKGTIIRDL